jgi:O-antigen ligase
VSASEALFLLTALAWVVRRLADRQVPWVRSPLNKPLVALVALTATGLVHSPEPSVVLNTVIMFAAFIPVHQMVVAEATPADLRTYLFVIVTAGGLLGLLAIAQSAALGPSEVGSFGDVSSGRAAGTFNHPNGLGGFEALALPCALALALRPASALRFWALALVPAILAGLGLSLSRGGIIAAAGALLVMLSWARFRRASLTFGVAAVLALLIAGSPFGQLQWVDNVQKRVTSVSYSAGGADPRFGIWQATRKMIEDHPVFGVGANQYPAVSSRYGVIDTAQPDSKVYHAHNTALTITAELGFVGLLASGWLVLTLALVLLRAIRRSGPAERGLAIAIAALMTAAFLQGLVDYALGSNVVRGLLLSLAGAAVVLSRHEVTPKPAA